MGKLYDRLTPELRAWLAGQRLFFVATAPLDSRGHVNCSPKGGDTFRALGDREVAFVDLTGSGIETVSHLQENGRIVLMFCAFDGAPKIVRLHGRGEVLYPAQPDFARVSAAFPALPGTRAIIRVTVDRISDSCGFGVPHMDFVEARDTLARWTEKQGDAGLADYRQRKNRLSIDGLPGYASPPAGNPRAHSA
ncbi:MAG TPA: pyridoxamine 5'-phosphate oxidase family protein [Opitutus sp.]|nr:pyridoxamine 5'-phosphate oxidase family protein [Opitutus sp.]